MGKQWWIKSQINTLVMSLRKWAKSNYRMKFLTAYAKLDKHSLQLCKLWKKEELEKKEKLLILKQNNPSLLHLLVIELNRCKPHPMLNNCNQRDLKRSKVSFLKLFLKVVLRLRF
jgi:hypothetical protein